MRRFLAWVAGAAGGLAAYRFLTRRPQPQPVTAPEEPVDPRAAELRARLDASREPELESEPEPEPASDSLLQADDETPEQRRARVHERGRSAVEEMRGTE